MKNEDEMSVVVTNWEIKLEKVGEKGFVSRIGCEDRSERDKGLVESTAL